MLFVAAHADQSLHLVCVKEKNRAMPSNVSLLRAERNICSAFAGIYSKSPTQ